MFLKILARSNADNDARRLNSPDTSQPHRGSGTVLFDEDDLLKRAANPNSSGSWSRLPTPTSLNILGFVTNHKHFDSYTPSYTCIMITSQTHIHTLSSVH
jgi:hypothetical protein